MVEERNASDSNRGVKDFSDSIGRFFALSKERKLVAIKSIKLSVDFCSLDLRTFASERFSILYPAVARVPTSNLLLAVHPPQAYLLTDMKRSGNTPARQRIYAPAQEVISQLIDDDLFPIFTISELENGLVASRKNGPPVVIPVRFLELKDGLPREWLREIKTLFLLNCDTWEDKEQCLTDQLERTGKVIRDHLLSSYFAKCLWFAPRTNEFGMIRKSLEGITFQAYDPYEAQFRGFLESLVRKSDGGYEGNDMIAQVLPTPMKRNPWSSPTLHICSSHFRDLNKLDEYYSLYKGMQALCRIGAPVLVYEGQNPLESSTQVNLLRISSRTPEIFRPSVREYPTRELVWSDGTPAPESLDFST